MAQKRISTKRWGEVTKAIDYSETATDSNDSKPLTTVINIWAYACEQHII